MATQNLRGKVALITGGTKGIGLAIAQRLSSAGASLVLAYARDHAAAAAALSSLPGSGGSPTRSLLVQADASSPAQMRSLVEQTISKFDRLDIVVPNAGVLPMSPLASTTESTFDSTFALNVKGPFFLVQAAAPYLQRGEGEGGRVVFVSSGVARSSSVAPPYAVYAATKGAVEQLTRVLARDLGAGGVTVNAVAPGPTATDLFFEGKPEAVVKGIAGQSPFNRLGTPAEIAEVVAFFAAPDSSWVSGQVIGANGASFV